MHAFDFASRATKGARDYQEDSSAFWPAGKSSVGAAQPASADRLVAVLADGMGGHTAGALASRMVCESFVSAYAGFNGSRPERLLDALRSANDAIAAKVEANPVLSGMGSTLVAAALSDEGVEWVSVGDSPLLLYRRGEIAHLNEDHSLAPELDRLAALGRMTVDQAKADPRRHMLRSAVTGEELDLVDVSRRPLVLEEGDYVILASDGLHTLETPEIERIVSAYAADGAEAVAGALIRAVEAMRDPHQDNTTVMAVRPLAKQPWRWLTGSPPNRPFVPLMFLPRPSRLGIACMHILGAAMYGQISTLAFVGIEARPVEVQVRISPGQQAFVIVGLPDKAVAESRERVRNALHAVGLGMPYKHVTVNLAPADLPKEGSQFDLPILLAMMVAMQAIAPDAVAGIRRNRRAGTRRIDPLRSRRAASRHRRQRHGQGAHLPARVRRRKLPGPARTSTSWRRRICCRSSITSRVCRRLSRPKPNLDRESGADAGSSPT